jgi:hypothetical protein
MWQTMQNGRAVDGTRGASLPASRLSFGPASVVPDPIAIVDAAVRAVLADRLGGMRLHRRASAPVFADRLFSLRHAEALAPGTSILRVAPGTVVTPLARDLLKRQGVVVQLAGIAEFEATALGEWAFAIDADGGPVEALRRSLLEDAGRWVELEPSIEEIGGWITAGEGRGVLLATPDGAVAVWRACQEPGVRAALAIEPDDVRRASRSLGSNLIVVEPAGKSPSWLKQLATAFRQAGAPRVPERASWIEETRR